MIINVLERPHMSYNKRPKLTTETY